MIFVGRGCINIHRRVHRHNFVLVSAWLIFQAGENNPELYNDLKDYGNISEHMKKLIWEVMRYDVEPHGYQQYCINKIIEIKKIGLFLDMG